MKKLVKRIRKATGVLALSAMVLMGSAVNVNAEETTTDAATLAAQQALIAQQQQQYQEALAAQQQALLAQQQQQAALLQQYQQALAAQQQQLLNQQYAAAVEVQQAFLKQHTEAANQAFLLQQLQNQQYQQYQAMIQRCGLDYQSMLLDNYKKYQNAALKSFLGNNGY